VSLLDRLFGRKKADGDEKMSSFEERVQALI